MKEVVRRILDMVARSLEWEARLGLEDLAPKKGKNDAKKTN